MIIAGPVRMRGLSFDQVRRICVCWRIVALPFFQKNLGKIYRTQPFWVDILPPDQGRLLKTGLIL